MAQAPNLTELCEPIGSGENIQFDAYGHSVRTVVTDSSGVLILTTVLSRTVTRISTRNTTILHDNTPKKQEAGRLPVGELPMPTLLEQAASEEKHGWGETTLHGLTAAWKFACTPIRFVMTIYGLTIFAWGAMLFFLLLVIAPAMNHPGKDSDDPPRKKWIEIDSQILNALFASQDSGLLHGAFATCIGLSISDSGKIAMRLNGYFNKIYRGFAHRCSTNKKLVRRE